MSKGDKRRPMRVRHEEYARNFERTFGRKPGPRLQEAVERARKDFRATRVEPTPTHPDVVR